MNHITHLNISPKIKLELIQNYFPKLTDLQIRTMKVVGGIFLGLAFLVFTYKFISWHIEKNIKAGVKAGIEEADNEAKKKFLLVQNKPQIQNNGNQAWDDQEDQPANSPNQGAAQLTPNSVKQDEIDQNRVQIPNNGQGNNIPSNNGQNVAPPLIHPPRIPTPNIVFQLPNNPQAPQFGLAGNLGNNLPVNQPQFPNNPLHLGVGVNNNPGNVGTHQTPKPVGVHHHKQEPESQELKDLKLIEQEITLIIGSLLEQHEQLAFSSIEIDGKTVVDPDIEKSIIDLNVKLKAKLKDYPQPFFTYLQHQFEEKKQDLPNLQERIIKFGALIEHCSNFEDVRDDFINVCFDQLDKYMSSNLFKGPDYRINEKQKVTFTLYNGFFSILNKNFHLIKDPELKTNLKIKFANLPLIEEENRQTQYSNIFFSERDQLEVLIKHFNEVENKLVDDCIQFYDHGKRLSNEEIYKLAKLLCHDSPLSVNNLDKLHRYFDKLFLPSKINWSKKETAFNDIKQLLGYDNSFGFKQREVDDAIFFNKSNLAYDPKLISTFGWMLSPIIELLLACKGKRFFENQKGKPDAQLLIPRWYHATPDMNVNGILKDGLIEVRHGKEFEGAWVSNERELTMGTATLVFTHAITQLDPKPRIEYEKGVILWRGIHRRNIKEHGIDIEGITMQSKDGKPHLISVGYMKRNGIKKAAKKETIEKMRAKGIQPIVLSNILVVYIQKMIHRTIGNPNLTEPWWGKGDVKVLEGGHQAKPQAAPQAATPAPQFVI